LSLSLILSLSDVHQLPKMMNGHLNIAVLGMNISEKLVGLALLVAGASLHLTLAHFQEAGQACDGLI